MKSIVISGLSYSAARFINAAVFCCAMALQIATGAAAAAGPHLDPGPMIGHVGPNEMRLWLRATGPCVPAVRIGEQEDLSDARVVTGDRLATDNDFCGTLIVTNLKPATRYFYTVLLDNQPALHRPHASFTTAPLPGAKSHVRIAFVSCVGHFGHEAAAAWGDLAARTNFDLLLMLGDNHYANTTHAHHQRQAYYSHRRPAGFQEIAQRTPVYGIWDDHDFAGNDSDRTVKGKDEVLVLFKQFWANPSFGQPDDPGVYFKFTWGDLDFFMLDGRYHRSPNHAKDDGSKTMLGHAQLAWLKRELLASKARVKFLGSGSEWQSTGHADSWGSYRREREDLFTFIDQNRITGVLLLSGDRHFIAGYQIHRRFIEVTSGPMGSIISAPGHLNECFLKQTEGKLYCIYDVDTTGRDPVAALEVYRAGHGLVERRDFSWDEINGRKRLKLLPPPPAKPGRGR